MTKTFKIDGVELSEEQVKRLVVEYQKTSNGRFFFPEVRDTCWVIFSNGDCGSIINDSDIDKKISQGVFSTAEQAQKESARRQALVRLWKASEEYDTDVDWGDSDQDKYYTYYNHPTKKLYVANNRSDQMQFELPHFKTQEDCEKFAKENEKDILIYMGIN